MKWWFAVARVRSCPRHPQNRLRAGPYVVVVVVAMRVKAGAVVVVVVLVRVVRVMGLTRLTRWCGPARLTMEHRYPSRRRPVDA